MNHDSASVSEIIRDVFSGFQDFIPQFSPIIGEIMSAPVLLLAGAIIIFLGVAGEAFFKRTGIPDIAFLMVLGVIIGPILGIVSTDTVIEIVPYFAAVALILIMFDGGLILDFPKERFSYQYSIFPSLFFR